MICDPDREASTEEINMIKQLHEEAYCEIEVVSTGTQKDIKDSEKIS